MTRGSERAYEQVRDGILRGAYTVGSRLREEEIAANIGTSRSPVRDALRRLGDEGLVDLVPNRGAVVATWDEGELDVILDMRAMLEGYATRLAAHIIEDHTLDELAALCDSAEELLKDGPDAMSEIAEVNQQFHQLILTSSGSRRLITTMQAVVRVPLLMGVVEEEHGEAMRRSLHHHREIVQALRYHDSGWAESIMQTHIRAARGARREERLSPHPLRGE